MGATSPGRWQDWQRRWKIGATSREKVIAAGAVSAAGSAAANPAAKSIAKAQTIPLFDPVMVPRFFFVPVPVPVPFPFPIGAGALTIFIARRAGATSSLQDLTARPHPVTSAG